MIAFQDYWIGHLVVLFVLLPHQVTMINIRNDIGFPTELAVCHFRYELKSNHPIALEHECGY